MARSNIEWTELVWNLLRGCSRKSPGCEHCYAEGIAARFSGPGLAYEGLAEFGAHGARWTGEVRIVPGALAMPLHWREPRVVFVNSMSDLFHERVPFEFIAATFGVMAQTPRHTYQVLTKREARMLEFFEWLENASRRSGPPPSEVVTTCAANHIDIDQVVRPWPLPNVLLGVSVENQGYADKRLPVLKKLRGRHAARTMVSYEPALGPVVFGDAMPDWVIFGGESGPGARSCDLAWAEAVRDECAKAGSAFFMKQTGSKAFVDGSPLVGLRRKKGGALLDIPEGLRIRQQP